MILYCDKVFVRKMYSFYPVGGMFYLKCLHDRYLNMEECYYFALGAKVEWFDQWPVVDVIGTILGYLVLQVEIQVNRDLH